MQKKPPFYKIDTNTLFSVASSNTNTVLIATTRMASVTKHKVNNVHQDWPVGRRRSTAPSQIPNTHMNRQVKQGQHNKKNQHQQTSTTRSSPTWPGWDPAPFIISSNKTDASPLLSLLIILLVLFMLVQCTANQLKQKHNQHKQKKLSQTKKN